MPIAMSKMPATLHGLLGLVALLPSAAAFADRLECLKSEDRVKAPYSVACGSKSECLATDQLDIKPLDASAPALKSACLLLEGAGPEAVDVLEMPATPSKTPLAYALASRIHDWQSNGKLASALAAAKGGHLFATAVLTDVGGSKYNLPFAIDVTGLWLSGALQLQLPDPKCEPCNFNGTVTLKVPNLYNWKQATKGDPSRLTLVASGIKLSGIPPEIVDGGMDGTLTYRLRRVDGNADNATAWAALIKRALTADQNVTFGLADDKGSVATAGSTRAFEVPSRDERAGATAICIVALTALLALVGWKTDWRLIRDSYGIPDSLIPAHDRSFSLGRCQMLWWTLIVVTAWVTVWYSTGSWFNLNDTALVLMGIGVGTAVGAMAATPARVTALLQDYQREKTLAAGAGSVALTNATNALTTEPGIKSEGFAKDLLTDFNGTNPGLHRLQAIVFTLGFGLAFLYQAFQEGCMPTLPTTALSLLGISGTAYVGFKMAG